MIANTKDFTKTTDVRFGVDRRGDELKHPADATTVEALVVEDHEARTEATGGDSAAPTPEPDEKRKKSGTWWGLFRDTCDF